MEYLKTDKDGRFKVKFGNEELLIKSTPEFEAICMMASAGYKPGALEQLLRVASLYNYYDATNNDIKAGEILINNRPQDVESMQDIAKGLLELEDYKKHYLKTYKMHDKLRVRKGKEKFKTMIDNAGLY